MENIIKAPGIFILYFYILFDFLYFYIYKIGFIKKILKNIIEIYNIYLYDFYINMIFI